MCELNDKLLDSYDYASDPLLQKCLHAWDRVHVGAMMSYAPVSGFGKQMMAHQNRTAHDGANFLRFLGFSERAARNFRASMLFHDIGKTHSTYNPSIWSLFERPTPEEKALQKRHARLGADMFESQARRTPELLKHPHFKVRHAVTLYHHERVDGTGPEGTIATGLPVFVQVSCIVDAYDGDRIYRPHQERRRTSKEALLRLAGIDDPKKKYVGAFGGRLIGQYLEFKEREMGAPTSLSARRSLPEEDKGEFLL